MSIVIRKLSDPEYPSEEELEKIRSILDEEIDFSDAPETDKEFWSKATKVSPKIDNKTQVSVFLEQDLMEWLMREAKTQQTDFSDLVSSILSSYKQEKA